MLFTELALLTILIHTKSHYGLLVTDIRWRVAEVNSSKTADGIADIGCFKEILKDDTSLYKMFRVTAVAASQAENILGASCMVRLPTNVDLLFSPSFVDKRSMFRMVYSSNTNYGVASYNYQPGKSATKHVPNKHVQTNETTTPRTGAFQGPIYVPCRFATLYFKPADVHEWLDFMLLHPRNGGMVRVSNNWLNGKKSLLHEHALDNDEKIEVSGVELCDLIIARRGLDQYE